jgi:tetratricopeptide (TPR) repeat protein
MLASEVDRQPQPADADETLILISEFANYGGGQIGYNLAGRLQETVYDLVQESGVESVRVERLDEAVLDEESAEQIGRDFNADIVVWGEYDTGRIVAVVSSPEVGSGIVSRERRWRVKTVEELSTRINADVPSDVSWISLYVLGRAHYLADRTEQAEAVFQRVLSEPLENHATRASVYFTLGRIEAGKEASNPDKVIAYYTEALEFRPGMVQALNNRGIAYLKRESVGDLTRAEADFERALAIDSTLGDTRLNLALTLIRQDPDHLPEVIALLEQAAVLQPESPGVQNGLCWYLSLAGRPEEALPHCDKAVELDQTGYSNDSRGLALAMLARYEEAVAEFKLFLEIIEREDPEAYDHFAATRWIWIEALESGKSPFPEAVLKGLLNE